MKAKKLLLATLLAAVAPGLAAAAEDSRKMVELPEMMQEHMLGNMRDHLAALDEILEHLGNESFDQAAEVAESRLRMSSMALHDAEHMGPFMPPGMRQTGTAMHKAASHFAVVTKEGAHCTPTRRCATSPPPAWPAIQATVSARKQHNLSPQRTRINKEGRISVKNRYK